MIKDNRLGRLVWAAGLCMAGVVLLVFNLGLLSRFEPAAQYLLAALLFLGGISFFGAFAAARDSWWRLMPAWTLIALSAMAVISTIESVDSRLNAGLLFVGLAIAFSHIYLINRRERWWTIIPGGFMLVIGIVVMLSSYIERPETLGGFLFLGMGGVFFLLYALGRTNHRWWSLIPAAILGIFGLFIFSLNGFGQDGETAAFLQWWPIFLILIGAVVAYRTYRQPPPEDKILVKSAPTSKRTHPSTGVTIEAQPVRSLSDSADRDSNEERIPKTSIEILPEE